jgi:hypothetical protein
MSNAPRDAGDQQGGVQFKENVMLQTVKGKCSPRQNHTCFRLTRHVQRLATLPHGAAHRFRSGVYNRKKRKTSASLAVTNASSERRRKRARPGQSALLLQKGQHLSRASVTRTQAVPFDQRDSPQDPRAVQWWRHCPNCPPARQQAPRPKAAALSLAQSAVDVTRPTNAADRNAFRNISCFFLRDKG